MTPLLVGTFGARSADELLDVLRDDAAALADLVELRLDLLADGRARVEELVRAAPRGVVATCRRASDGGGFRGDERARFALLRAAVDAGAAWIDLEHDVPETDLTVFASGPARILRSRHVDRLPEEADLLAARLVAPPATAGKLVAREGGAEDAFRALDLVARNGRRLSCHVVSSPFTRPAGASLGAPFSYAAILPGAGLGLRLPTVRWMHARARWRRVAEGKPLFVLLGGDVEGSVGPDLLNAAFESGGPDLVALRWSCDDAAPALAAIRRFGWAGAAVTMPHKERVLDILAAGGRLAPTAREVGAVNTVVREDGELVGHNTDLGGLLDALTPHLPPEGVGRRSVLVIGAGGAARAAIAAARRLGATPVVLARNAERIAALGAEVARDAADAASRAPAIVIDATPAGPPGGTAVFDPAALPQPAIVLDMLVHAAPTALLDAAARAGHRTVAGFELLLAQAAHQVVRLGGEAPHRDRMRRAGEAALARRDAPIVLVGLRGAGKTTVGRLLADLLGRPFVDSDDEACVRGAAPVDEILRTRGEPLFRGIEGEVLRDLARRPGTVVATGGGAALHREAFGALAAAGVVVLLDAPDDVLLARAAAAPRLPLTPLAPAAEIAAQRAERMPLYRAAASLSVDVAATDARAAAERIAAWWDERSLPEMPISEVEGT